MVKVLERAGDLPSGIAVNPCPAEDSQSDVLSTNSLGSKNACVWIALLLLPIASLISRLLLLQR
jgi:hypothetical protein